MIYPFFITAALFLLLLQTAVFPSFSSLAGFYDLLTPLVIYLGFIRGAREGLPLVLLMGLMSDALSGGYFGSYMTAYLWLFLMVRWLITFLHVKHTALIPFVVVAAVLMQNGIFLLIFSILDPAGTFAADTARIVVHQVLWAVFTGPLLLLLFSSVLHKWKSWLQLLFAG
jgi:cell shape-determining protein MreD